MKEFIDMGLHEMRRFFREKVSAQVFVNVIGFLVVIALLSVNLKCQNDKTTAILAKLEGAMEKVDEVEEKVVKAEKKVDFRYFNLTRSLQDIHNIEIETKQGRVVKK